MKSHFLPFLLSLTLIVGAGCSKKSSDEQRSGQSITAQNGNVSEVLTVQKRENKAPNFSWKDSSGATVDLASYSGRINVINFWATWCGPCKHELPDLISLQTDYASKGVRLIGVSADVGSNVAADVRSFVHDHGINYPVVIANDDMKEAFGNVNMLPTTFITDRDGNILATLVGARSKSAFADAINGFLK